MRFDAGFVTVGLRRPDSPSARADNMRKRVNLLLTACWLLLSAATVTAWVRSYWMNDAAWVSEDDNEIRFEGGWGKLTCRVRVGEDLRCLPGMRMPPTQPATQAAVVAVVAPPQTDRHTTREPLRIGGFTSPAEPPAAGRYYGAPSYFDRAGFAVAYRAGAFESRFIIGVPYWFILLILFARPAWRWLRARHVRRRAEWRRLRALCHACGYDLRGTAERCPECGSAARAATQAGLPQPIRGI